MFKSAQAKTLIRKATDILWPAIGWRRSTRYWRHRLVRLKDSNYSIAAGLAFGAAISFTPVPGAHVLGALALCLLFRANLIAGMLGTLIGNPWTIPFMWWFAYIAGKFSFIQMGFQVRQMPGHFEWRELVREITHDTMQLFAPWLAGGVILMILSWPVFYFIFYWIIDHLRETHHLWKTTRLHKEARAITGQVK